jgi:DNA-binding Lrp family transcriptional regulator
MGKTYLSEREKELLTILGNHPHISMKELFSLTAYKRASSISRKIDEFKRDGILYGPSFDIDYGKLCKNTVRMLTCIIESSQNYEVVTSYLKLIESLWALYPVLSPRKELLNVLFLSSNDIQMKGLFQLLKRNNIITDFTIHVCSSRRVLENPNFFGSTNPSLDNLLNPCDVPDLSFGCHDTNWNECDIDILPYLRIGYRGGKLIEILKAEKRSGKPWTYEQIKYSFRKMLKKGLIKKIYFMYPLPFEQCADFNLYLRTDDMNVTKEIICNFARGERVSREYMFCRDWGYIGFASHPQFMTGLIHKLNKIDVIKEKEIYPLRSYPDRENPLNQPLTLKYFDFDNQTLKYPYLKYRERICEKLENDTIN